MTRKPLSNEEFKKAGYKTIDWIANYWENIENQKINPNSKPNDVLNLLPKSAPLDGEPFDKVIDDLNKIILPNILHWQHPGFFGYFPANSSGSAVLGDLISSGLGVIGMLWSTSPACTELEIRVLDWLQELLGLPSFYHSTSKGGGIIQDTASSSSLIAMIAARESTLKYCGNSNGLANTNYTLVAYISKEAHSSLQKAARICGIGDKNLAIIPSDKFGSIIVDELEAKIKMDIQSGKIPFFVGATLGSTGIGAFDSLIELGPLCKRYNLWLHADAAMMGAASICPEYRLMHEGIEYTQSWCFNPHKWLLTTFDCNTMWIKDRKKLTNALGILPSYLRNNATLSGEVIDFRDWQIPLGRRFRALKLWMVIRHHGSSGLQDFIRHHINLAKRLESGLKEMSQYSMPYPRSFTLNVFKHRKGNKRTEEIMNEVNKRGNVFISSTKFEDLFLLRACTGQFRTTEKHIDLLLKELNIFA